MEAITAQLYANYGVLALGCIVFAWVIVHLWRFFTAEREKHITACANERNALVAKHDSERAALAQQHTAERTALLARIDELQDLRVNDMRMANEQYAALTRETARASSTVAGALDQTRAALEDVLERKAGG